MTLLVLNVINLFLIVAIILLNRAISRNYKSIIAKKDIIIAGYETLVDDFFGGKVLKQEATKVVILTQNGEVKYAFTKKKADKGFNYKLVREGQEF